MTGQILRKLLWRALFSVIPPWKEHLLKFSFTSNPVKAKSGEHRHLHWKEKKKSLNIRIMNCIQNFPCKNGHSREHNYGEMTSRDCWGWQAYTCITMYLFPISMTIFIVFSLKKRIQRQPGPLLLDRSSSPLESSHSGHIIICSQSELEPPLNQTHRARFSASVK